MNSAVNATKYGLSIKGLWTCLEINLFLWASYVCSRVMA